MRRDGGGGVLTGLAGYGATPARSRLFVAVRFQPRIRERIARATEVLRALEGVRPVHIEQLHLTLRFIGEADRSLEAPLALEIAAATADMPRFNLTIRSAGVFPSLRRARVIWVGVDEDATLTALQSRVEAAVVRVGLDPEPRSFRPHVTVGRIRRAGRHRDLADAISRVSLETTVAVHEVFLMRSKLLPRGARHEEVASCPLGVGGT